MHGGRELVREENATEVEYVKSGAHRDLEQRHVPGLGAGMKARKASGKVKRAESNAQIQDGIGSEMSDANRGQLDERRH